MTTIPEKVKLNVEKAKNKIKKPQHEEYHREREEFEEKSDFVQKTTITHDEEIQRIPKEQAGLPLQGVPQQGQPSTTEKIKGYGKQLVGKIQEKRHKESSSSSSSDEEARRVTTTTTMQPGMTEQHKPGFIEKAKQQVEGAVGKIKAKKAEHDMKREMAQPTTTTTATTIPVQQQPIYYGQQPVMTEQNKPGFIEKAKQQVEGTVQKLKTMKAEHDMKHGMAQPTTTPTTMPVYQTQQPVMTGQHKPGFIEKAKQQVEGAVGKLMGQPTTTATAVTYQQPVYYTQQPVMTEQHKPGLLEQAKQKIEGTVEQLKTKKHQHEMQQGYQPGVEQQKPSTIEKIKGVGYQAAHKIQEMTQPKPQGQELPLGQKPTTMDKLKHMGQEAVHKVQALTGQNQQKPLGTNETNVVYPEGQSNIPLTGAPLTGAPLTGAPLTGAPLTGVPLTGAPLTGQPGSGYTDYNYSQRAPQSEHIYAPPVTIESSAMRYVERERPEIIREGYEGGQVYSGGVYEYSMPQGATQYDSQQYQMPFSEYKYQVQGSQISQIEGQQYRPTQYVSGQSYEYRPESNIQQQSYQPSGSLGFREEQMYGQSQVQYAGQYGVPQQGTIPKDIVRMGSSSSHDSSSSSSSSAEDGYKILLPSQVRPGVGTGLGTGVGTGLGAGVGTGLGAGMVQPVGVQPVVVQPVVVQQVQQQPVMGQNMYEEDYERKFAHHASINHSLGGPEYEYHIIGEGREMIRRRSRSSSSSSSSA